MKLNQDYFATAAPGNLGELNALSSAVNHSYSRLQSIGSVEYPNQVDLSPPRDSGRFLVVQSGAGVAKCGWDEGVFFDVNPGDIIKIPPKEVVQLTPDTGNPFQCWELNLRNDEGLNWDYRKGPILVRGLPNEIGGCNDGSQIDRKLTFRKLAHSTQTKYRPPSDNPFLGVDFHPVGIFKGSAKTHYHPKGVVLGPDGKPVAGLPEQLELYLVLEPISLGIDKPNATELLTWANPELGGDPDKMQIEAGSVIYLPAGVGHGLFGSMVVVVALQEFRMSNEVDIGDTVEGHIEKLKAEFKG